MKEKLPQEKKSQAATGRTGAFVKLKTAGTIIPDKGISVLANAIRLVAEVSLYGSERADKTETMTVTPGEIAAILQGSVREGK